MLKLKKGEWFLFIVNLLVLSGFAIYYTLKQNYEFIIYIGVITFFLILILATWNKTNFDYWILSGLTVWAIMHMCGGGIRIGGEILYTFVLIPIIEIGGNVILRYDHVVHFIGFGVTTLVGWHLIKPYLNNKTNYKVIYVLVILIGMGVGALNEIIEFIAVVVMPATNVGGYYNNSLDLVFNTFGAICAVVIIHFQRKKSLKHQ